MFVLRDSSKSKLLNLQDWWSLMAHYGTLVFPGAATVAFSTPTHFSEAKQLWVSCPLTPCHCHFMAFSVCMLSSYMRFFYRSQLKTFFCMNFKKTVLQSSVGIAAYSGKSKPSHFYAQWIWPQPGGSCVLSEGAGVLPGFRALPKILQELIWKIWVVSICCLPSH